MKKRYLLLIVFIFLGLQFVNKTFSRLKPVERVSFKSEALDFDKQEAGAYKIDKSAKWIGKGKALITIDVTSIPKEKAPAKDVIFVLGVSGSVGEGKLEQIKKDTAAYAKTLFNNPKNRAALITFDTKVKKLLDFTSNKEEFLKQVKDITFQGLTSYKAALDEVKNLLNDYKKEEGRDLILLFLSDGFPSTDTPNEVAVYNELREKHPYLKTNAVQYEMGEDIKSTIKSVSEYQFKADMEGLHNTLLRAGANPLAFDNFIITDVISSYFKTDSKKIKTSHGKAVLDDNKVVWDLGTYLTGDTARMEIEVEHTGDLKDLYNTNDGIKIETSLNGKKDNHTSDLSPVLKDAYKVIFDANAPKDCTVKNLDKDMSVRPFESVKIPEGKATCDGYLFQGYKILSKVKYLNDDYFEMPDSDVVLHALWSKMNVNKSMDGKIAKVLTLYEKVKLESVGNENKVIDFEKSNSKGNGEGVYIFEETKNDPYPVYYYRGTHDVKNNVIYNKFCWKIVRTTDTAGVRLIYNGKAEGGKCLLTNDGETSIGEVQFNTTNNYIPSVGYMYGDDIKPYENTNDSNAKIHLDKWYEENIKGKDDEAKLDTKAIYCNDRREEPRNLGTDLLFIQYKAYNRFLDSSPSLTCELNDSFGVDGGNKKLKYPLGLISGDEIIMAGFSDFNPNQNFYLNTDYNFWVMTPAMVTFMSSVMFFGNGSASQDSPTINYHLRPVLTINNATILLGGDGSKESPYII